MVSGMSMKIPDSMNKSRYLYMYYTHPGTVYESMNKIYFIQNNCRIGGSNLNLLWVIQSQSGRGMDGTFLL